MAFSRAFPRDAEVGTSRGTLLMHSLLRSLAILAPLAIGCAADADVPALTKKTLIDGKVSQSIVVQ
jgi:hypothetical protein